MKETIKLTPIEQIILNSQRNRARMALCESVQGLVAVLEEIQNVKQLPPDCTMHDPGIVAAAIKEEREIIKTLCNLADVWELQEGVSA